MLFELSDTCTVHTAQTSKERLFKEILPTVLHETSTSGQWAWLPYFFGGESRIIFTVSYHFLLSALSDKINFSPRLSLL